MMLALVLDNFAEDFDHSSCEVYQDMASSAQSRPPVIATIGFHELGTAPFQLPSSTVLEPFREIRGISQNLA